MQSSLILDEFDRRLIAALQLNGRAQWKDIAKALGSSESTVVRRGRHLCDSGVVRVIGFVDTLRCGLGVPVLTRMTCPPAFRERLSAEVRAHRQVRYATTLAGSADIVAEFVVGAHRNLARLLSSDLPGADVVTSTETLTVMRTFHSTRAWEENLLAPESVTLLRPEGGDPTVERYWREPLALDDVDLAILAALGENGRKTVKQLAQEAGTSESTAARRLERLVSEGCVYFRTVIHPALLGFATEILIWLSVDSGALEDVAQQLVGHPSVKFVWVTTGRLNICAGAHLRHNSELYAFEADVLGSLKGVRVSEITPHVTTLKRAWIDLLEGGIPSRPDHVAEAVRGLAQ
ncbi:Lrp/AsnC family transcriptional regulator [Streptomyces sp. NPDC004542]|uniref:Lrp/AsnC family transcriptional regulator n=1 Tax=Streptomyces sp. NPDC004542 TaxID=3154281 RepID=UPI0033AC4905